MKTKPRTADRIDPANVPDTASFSGAFQESLPLERYDRCATCSFTGVAVGPGGYESVPFARVECPGCHLHVGPAEHVRCPRCGAFRIVTPGGEE